MIVEKISFSMEPEAASISAVEPGNGAVEMEVRAICHNFLAAQKEAKLCFFETKEF